MDHYVCIRLEIKIEILIFKVIHFLVEAKNEEPVSVANDPADPGGC